MAMRNWMPYLVSGCVVRIILVSFVFHRSDKILPLFPWCSNPCRALVAVPATLLGLLAVAVSPAAGLFHRDLDDWPPHLSARINLQTPQGPPFGKVLGTSLPASLLLMKRLLDLHRAPQLRKFLSACLLASCGYLNIIIYTKNSYRVSI